jgi:hypothetical protein
MARRGTSSTCELAIMVVLQLVVCSYRCRLRRFAWVNKPANKQTKTGCGSATNGNENYNR